MFRSSGTWWNSWLGACIMNTTVKCCFGSFQNDVPAAPPGCGAGADLPQMVGGHERNRCWSQDAVDVEGAAVLQHLQEFRVIEGCGNHALAACFPFGGKSR